MSHRSNWKARMSVLVAIAVLCGMARAQVAPAGNAHPETVLVDESNAEAAPFGEPRDVDAATTEQKQAFAAEVDLEPLRALPVFHNGRVKILDTLARETVRALAGRAKWFDLALPDGATQPTADAAARYRTDGPLEKAKFDPLFTLLDLAIDPAHYEQRPLIAVDYLPLRRLYLDAALEGEDDIVRERWLRLGTISPAMGEAYTQAIFNEHGDDGQIRTAIGRIDRGLELAHNSGANFDVVAPAEIDQPWAHLNTLPEDHPARIAATKLGVAWRALDAPAASAAAAELAAALEAIHPETHPSSRADLELVYNRGQFFDWGMWVYLFSFLALVLAFGTGRRWLVWSGVGLLVVAIALHAIGFGLRCYLAERFAIQNQYESMTGLSLFAALAGASIMLWRRQWLFGAAAAGTGFLILTAATQTGIPGQAIEREAAILNTSVLLKYHVTTVLTSYGLITLGFIASLFYLGAHYGKKLFGTSDAQLVAAAAVGGNPDASIGTHARLLADLDRAQITVLQLAFWTLGVGILLGAWWADHSWGRWWAFDPKETWALVTWIVYLIVIHLRFAGVKDRGLWTAWLSVAGFAVMLWTYFGVNLLLPGLHAYA